MPPFDLRSQRRISDVVRHVESEWIDTSAGRPPYRGNAHWVWFLLTEDFDPDDNYRAKAKPGNWSAAANSGAGELSAEPVAWYYVRDTTKHSNAGEGDWVLCRPIGSVDGLVWEVVTPGVGFDRCTCKLAEEMTADLQGFTVDNVKPISGSSPLMDPDSTTETLEVYNAHAWTADDNALARIEWHKTNERWEFYQVDC